jgi:hypothetical protein
METISDPLLKILEEYVRSHGHEYELVEIEDVREDTVMVHDSIKYSLGPGQRFRFHGGEVEEGALLEVNDLFGDGSIWRVYTISDGKRAWVLSST